MGSKTCKKCGYKCDEECCSIIILLAPNKEVSKESIKLADKETICDDCRNDIWANYFA